MLYNFPREEILKFYSKIFGKQNQSASPNQNGRFCSELYESIANFNYKFDPKEPENGDLSVNENERISEHDSEQDDSLRAKSQTLPSDRSISSHRKSSRDVAVNPRGQFSAELPARRGRKNSYVQKLLKHKVVPSNVSNLIAIWCDSIYEEYGTNDKLYLPEFKEWANIHKNVIFTFARYFRYTMWQMQKNRLTNRPFLGFHNMTPVLQEDLLIKFSNERNFKQALGCLYIEFLFVWYDRHRSVPNKIKILRDVGIAFNDSLLEIDIAHFSAEYHNFTIKLSRQPVYLYWKEILTNYSRSSKQ